MNLAGRLTPFPVRGVEELTLWDARTPSFPRSHYHAASEAFDRTLRERALSLRRETTLCGRQTELEILRGRELDPSDTDPTLGVVNLVGFNEEGPVGGFTLYNCKTIDEDEDALLVSAMPMPGLEVPDRPAWEVCAAVLLHFLRSSVPLDDGRELQVLEWRFPQREGHRWVNGRLELEAGIDFANRTLNALGFAGAMVSRTREGVPVIATAEA